MGDEGGGSRRRARGVRCLTAHVTDTSEKLQHFVCSAVSSSDRWPLVEVGLGLVCSGPCDVRHLLLPENVKTLFSSIFNVVRPTANGRDSASAGSTLTDALCGSRTPVCAAPGVPVDTLSPRVSSWTSGSYAHQTGLLWSECDVILFLWRRSKPRDVCDEAAVRPLFTLSCSGYENISRKFVRADWTKTES